VNPWGYLDTSGAWDGAAAMPEQLEGALGVALGAAEASDFDFEAPTGNVVAFAQGTGAAACECVAALTAAQLSVPFSIVRDGRTPKFVAGHTLAFAVALRGEGAEVAAVAADAAQRGARLVLVGAGEIQDAPLRSALRPPLRCDLADAGSPRAQLASAVVSVLAVLAACDLVPDPAASVAAAGRALADRRDVWLVPDAAPERLARRLGRTIPLVYGAEGVGAVAARWWKSGVNRNAKAPAFAGSLPAVTYDELAGWGQGGDVTRQAMSLVLLRHGGEPESAGVAFESVRAVTDEVMANLFDVHGEGADDLGRFFDLALYGELVSLHLAGREGVDPGPAPAIEETSRSQPTE
jgi:glucose/mannose-6-phosphate isomerase